MSVFICTFQLPREACVTCKFSVNNGIKCEYELEGARLGQKCNRYSCRSCARRVVEHDYCQVHAAMVEKDHKIPKQKSTPRVALRFRTCGWMRSSGSSVFNISPMTLYPGRSGSGWVTDLDFQEEWDRGRPWAVDDDWSHEEFVQQMRASYRNNRSMWNRLLDEPRATFRCDCMAPSCHRAWLAEILVRLGATHLGDDP